MVAVNSDGKKRIDKYEIMPFSWDEIDRKEELARKRKSTMMTKEQVESIIKAFEKY